MTLTYDGTNGLFTRLGKLFGLADAVRTHQQDVLTRIAAIQAEYTSADSYMVGELVGQMTFRVQVAGAILSDIQRAAETTLVEMCYADAALNTRSPMPTRTVADALSYLIREMAADSESIDASVISKSATTAGGTNTGNGTLLYTELPPPSLNSGVTQFPNIRTERIEIRCVQDSSAREIPAGSERFRVRGQSAFGNLDYRFPAGSGVDLVMSCLNPAMDTGARYENLLRNSAFEAYTTANIPDYFTVSTGTAGTHFGESTTVYRGAKSFRFIGDGATLAKVRQQMAADAGTPHGIISDRLYLLAVAARTSAAPSAGNVRVSLQNAAGTIVTGAQIDIPYTIGTTYGWQYAFFRAPVSLPSSVYVSLEQTTALNAGATMFLDEMVLAEVRQFAPGSQGIVILPGSTDWAVNDSITLKATNDNGGKFCDHFDRFYAMYEKGLLLPANASGAETILDTLIS
jgi:hypothetical protein